jgi:hypothetical protein
MKKAKNEVALIVRGLWRSHARAHARCQLLGSAFPNIKRSERSCYVKSLHEKSISTGKSFSASRNCLSTRHPVNFVLLNDRFWPTRRSAEWATKADRLVRLVRSSHSSNKSLQPSGCVSQAKNSDAGRGYKISRGLAWNKAYEGSGTRILWRGGKGCYMISIQDRSLPT